MRGVWGGHYGNGVEDIGSGNVYTLNSLFLDYPQKQVVRASSAMPAPGKACTALIEFAADPGYVKLAYFLGRYLVYSVVGL